MLKSFAGGRLFGATWGDAPPTVLALHGWGRTHADFAGAFGDPADPVPCGVLAPDLPGFGATPAPPEPWGSDQYAAELVPLFEERGALADRVVVVGHSHGGRVALQLQRRVPDRIERLVLTGVPLLDREGRRTRPPVAYRMGRRLHRLGLVGEQRMETLRGRYGSPDYRAATGVMRGVLVKVLAEQYADELPHVECAVELLWGSDDREVPLEVAERAVQLFPHATLEVVPGVGHLLPTEAPAALRRALATDDPTGAPEPQVDVRGSGGRTAVEGPAGAS